MTSSSSSSSLSSISPLPLSCPVHYISIFLCLSLSLSVSLSISLCLSACPLSLSLSLSLSLILHIPHVSMCVYTISAWNDWVRCFCCGIGVREWAPGDDPWAEHARWSPRCSFVRLMGKSQSSYDECSSRHESHENKVNFSLEHFVK